jgi:ribosomal protein S24E
MDIEIQETQENPLLKRERYQLEVDHSGETTPSKDKVRKQLAAEHDLDPEKIDVRHVYTGFGKTSSRAELLVYEDKVVVEEDEEEPSDEPEEQVDEDDAEEAEEQAEETVEDEPDEEDTAEEAEEAEADEAAGSEAEEEKEE